MLLSPARTCALLSVLVACGDTEAPAPVVVPWDDDSSRLGHCTFVPAPARAARPALSPAPLSAGFAEGRLDLPIGTPLGAYGDRIVALGQAAAVDDRAARWATGFVPSVGMHDMPLIEALALEAGGERVVVVRLDAPFLTENVLFEVERLAAPDGSLRGRILLTASHSHATWGAWLPTVHLAAGGDRPRRELFERATAAIAHAIQESLALLAPARIGIARDDAFDPDDRVTADRRGENDSVVGPDGNEAGRGKDPAVWALRVDREDGSPLVALVNVAIHGTVGSGDNPLGSNDAPGAIARALASDLGYPVMHLQGAAGDVSPASAPGRSACPSDDRCLDMPGLEILGARASQALSPLVAGIETSSEAALEIVTRTFAVGRGGVVERPGGDLLYYLPPAVDRTPDRILFTPDGKAASPFDEFNTMAGAGLCGVEGGVTFSPLPGVAGLMPYANCIDLDRGGAGLVLGIFDIETPTLPICDSVRSTAAALRIGGLLSGDWLLLGIPGEPTAPFAAYLRNRSPAGPERTLLVGYSDEYSGYMLTSEDWLSGGYECSTNLWGPREGEQILEALVAAAAIAWTPEIEDPEAGLDRFEAYVFPPGEAVAALDTHDHGTPAVDSEPVWWPDTRDTLVAAESVVPRAVGVARFAWRGGDPAVDTPEVVVEREVEPGRFEPVMDARGRPASSARGVVIISYTPRPVASTTPDGHVYAASWQPTAVEPFSLSELARPFSLPLGSYRLRARGRAQSGGSVVDYDIASPAFAVVAAPLDPTSSAERLADGIEVQALLPAAPGLRALGDGPSDVTLPLLGPWALIVTLDDATTVVGRATPDALGRAVMPLTAAQAAQAVSIEVRDASDNGGVLPISP
jgi:neutral ceramidase